MDPIQNDTDVLSSLTDNAAIEVQIEADFCNSLAKFGVDNVQIDAFKQGPFLKLIITQESDLFFSLKQKSEAEQKYIEKESEYFARCVKAEEDSEGLEKENKQLQKLVNEFKYQLAKVKVERDQLLETVEKLKKELTDVKKKGQSS